MVSVRENDGVTPRQQYRKQLRGQIKQVARRHLAAGGAGSLSLSAVARELNMRGPSLYHYFPSRDALLTELLIEAYQQLDDVIAQATAAVTTPEEKLRHGALAYRQWAVTHPELFDLLYGRPVPGYVAPPETMVLARSNLLRIVDILAGASPTPPLDSSPAALPGGSSLASAVPDGSAAAAAVSGGSSSAAEVPGGSSSAGAVSGGSSSAGAVSGGSLAAAEVPGGSSAAAEMPGGSSSAGAVSGGSSLGAVSGGSSAAAPAGGSSPAAPPPEPARGIGTPAFDAAVRFTARLHGLLTLEINGHLVHMVADPEAVYRQELDEAITRAIA